MLRRISHLVTITLCLVLPLVASFSASSLTPIHVSSTTLSASRRAVLETTITAAIGTLVMASPVFAEGFEDLSMPSETDQKQAEVREINNGKRFPFYFSTTPPPYSTLAKTYLGFFPISGIFAGFFGLGGRELGCLKYWQNTLALFAEASFGISLMRSLSQHGHNTLHIIPIHFTLKFILWLTLVLSNAFGRMRP